MSLTRRAFAQSTLGSLLTYSLLETLLVEEAIGGEIKPLAAAWLADVDRLGREVKGQKITQLQWQEKVEALLAKVDLADLLKFIDFEKLTAGIKLRDKGARSIRPKFPKVEGLPTDLVFGRQVFAMKEGRSVVPHGHNNMATAFLVLQGSFRGRHFDRLADEEKHMIVKPTIDRTFKPGEYSTISDHKDNVHWFQAASETGYIFNFHVLNVNAEPEKKTGRVYIDPAGEKLSGGKIRARLINAAEAHDLYG